MRRSTSTPAECWTSSRPAISSSTPIHTARRGNSGGWRSYRSSPPRSGAASPRRRPGVEPFQLPAGANRSRSRSPAGDHHTDSVRTKHSRARRLQPSGHYVEVPGPRARSRHGDPAHDGEPGQDARRGEGRGTLAVGRSADISLLELRAGEYLFCDGNAGNTLPGKQLLIRGLPSRAGPRSGVAEIPELRPWRVHHLPEGT